MNEFVAVKKIKEVVSAANGETLDTSHIILFDTVITSWGTVRCTSDGDAVASKL